MSGSHDVLRCEDDAGPHGRTSDEHKQRPKRVRVEFRADRPFEGVAGLPADRPYAVVFPNDGSGKRCSPNLARGRGKLVSGLRTATPGG